MFRILFVDDEHNIVNYISSLFSNDDTYQLDVYKAYSAGEALKQLETTKIDVIVLDIEMPGKSGLALAAEISEKWPDIRIVFLTAYDDFNYIYKSHNFSNSEYILKTETDENIIEKVYKVIESLEKSRYTELRLKQLDNKDMFINHILSQTQLKQILETKGKKIIQGSINFDVDITKPFYIGVLNINTMYYHNNTNSYENNLKYILMFKSILSPHVNYSFFQYNNNNLFILVSQKKSESDDADLSNEQMSVLLTQLCECIIAEFNKLFTSLSIMSLYYKPCTLENCWDKFNILMEYTEFKAHNTINKSFVSIFKDEDYSILYQYNTISKVHLEKQYQKFKYELNRCEKDNLIQTLDYFKNECIKLKSMHNINAIKIYTSITMIFMEYISQNNLNQQLAMKIGIFNLYHIDNFKNWNEAFSYLNKLCECITQIASNQDMDRNQYMVNKIKNYIMSNSSGDVSLSKIAYHVNYNESYVSRIFKQVTGICLSDYINETRLDIAKEMLKNTDDTISEIAFNTGFDTSQYFSSVFKKKVGMSPSDYRNLNTSVPE